ncbi:transposase [Pseudorhodoferax soli]|uniref:Transposase n=2 Tax=Pseudorhodoferax soli TaxID=545864 RepID=A0A368XWQ6_9BURK|nr:transposase [Pseudorhodoferax soli]
MVSTNGIEVDTMEASQPAKRRRHDASLKQAVLEQCAAPGASVASIALAHGLNANLVHKWRREARPAPAGLGSTHDVGPEPRFIAVTLPPAVQRTAAEVVQLELRRGTLTVNCTWPVSSMSQCAAWLREILR